MDWTKRLRRGREECWKRLAMVVVGNLLRMKRMIDSACQSSLFCAFDRKHSSTGVWRTYTIALGHRYGSACSDA